MSRLFAAHLLQAAVALPFSGHYDPEQELWVGDNLLQGMKYPTTTQPPTGHWWEGATSTSGGCDSDEELVWEPDPDDHDVGP